MRAPRGQVRGVSSTIGIRLAVVVLLSVLIPASPAKGSEFPPCAAGRLTIVSETALSDRLHELSLRSDAMRGEQRIRVFLPSDYESEDGKRFPALFLLHGVGDTYTKWTEDPHMSAAVSASDGLIVVMPDGGSGTEAGWYSDWVTDEYCWESYHIGELVPFVDRHYRTFDDRSGRAIAGFSMGGFGAMSYAARHPGTFVAAGSFSGFLDTADTGPGGALVMEQGNPQLGTPTSEVWGDYMADEVTWRDHNPADLARNLHQTLVWFTSGNGVPMPGDLPHRTAIESGAYATNRLFAARLVQEDVDHVFVDRGHGTHEERYWAEDLGKFLAFLDEEGAFSKEPLVAFDYGTARSGFDVWGWRFDAEPARAKEFLRLRGVHAGGLSATGSGAVLVRTASLYRPGSRHLVTFDDGAPERILVADGRGRLCFEVDLGPPHTEQQYTVEGRVAEATDPGYWRTTSVRIEPAESPGAHRTSRLRPVCGSKGRPL